MKISDGLKIIVAVQYYVGQSVPASMVRDPSYIQLSSSCLLLHGDLLHCCYSYWPLRTVKLTYLVTHQASVA